MTQTTDTVERSTEEERSETTDLNQGSRTGEPPSWGELAEKANVKSGTRDMVLMGLGAIGILVATGISSAALAVLGVTALFSVFGFGDVKSGAITGAAVGALSVALLSGVGGLISAVFIVPLLLPAIIGLIAGVAGSYVGGKVHEKIRG